MRWNHRFVKNKSLSDQVFLLANFRVIFFFLLLSDRLANKTCTKIDEQIFLRSHGMYFIRKDRMNRSIETRQWIDDEDFSPRKISRDYVLSRIKVVYIEMSFRSNYLKRRTFTSCFCFFSSYLSILPPV